MFLKLTIRHWHCRRTSPDGGFQLLQSMIRRWLRTAGRSLSGLYRFQWTEVTATVRRQSYPIIFALVFSYYRLSKLNEDLQNHTPHVALSTGANVIRLLADRSAIGIIMSCPFPSLSVTLCIVAKRYILQQKCLKKWTGSALLETPLHYFWPLTPTLSPQTPYPQNFQYSTIGYLSNSWASCFSVTCVISIDQTSGILYFSYHTMKWVIQDLNN